VVNSLVRKVVLVGIREFTRVKSPTVAQYVEKRLRGGTGCLPTKEKFILKKLKQT
jgi:hypothetical protein